MSRVNVNNFFFYPIGHKRIQIRCGDYNSMESVIKTTRTSFVRGSKIWNAYMCYART